MVENYVDTYCLLEIQIGNPQEQKETHLAKLKNLPNVIPNIISFNIGFDILNLERSFDLGLVAVYADRAALDFYTEHAVHQEAAKMGKEIAERVVSVDFISE